MAELKPYSIRMEEETNAKIRELANEIGGNQQLVMSKLIEAYEFQRGKSMLIAKKEDIEQFEKYASILTSMFMRSLEDNQNVTETVRTEFEAQLQSKDTTIADLQSERDQLKERDAEISANLEVMEKERKEEHNRHLNEWGELTEQNNQYKKMLTDKDQLIHDKEQLNQALASTIREHEQKLHEAEEQKKNYTKLNGQLHEAEKRADTLQTQLQQKEIEHEKAVLQLDRKYQDEIQQIKAEQQKEIDRYQNKYFELMEKIQVTPEQPTQEKKKPVSKKTTTATKAKTTAGEKNETQE